MTDVVIFFLSQWEKKSHLLHLVVHFQNEGQRRSRYFVLANHTFNVQIAQGFFSQTVRMDESGL